MIIAARILLSSSALRVLQRRRACFLALENFPDHWQLGVELFKTIVRPPSYNGEYIVLTTAKIALANTRTLIEDHHWPFLYLLTFSFEINMIMTYLFGALKAVSIR